MPEFLRFGSYRVPVSDLLEYEYACDPTCCMAIDAFCCARFDIGITFEEEERITALLPEIARRCRWLRRGEGYVDPFTRKPSELLIDKRADETCSFNYRGTDGRFWCAVHTVAEELGMDPFKVKPLPCSLWPWALEGRDLLRLDLESNPPCLKKRTPDGTYDRNLLALLQPLAEND